MPMHQDAEAGLRAIKIWNFRAGLPYAWLFKWSFYNWIVWLTDFALWWLDDNNKLLLIIVTLLF